MSSTPDRQRSASRGAEGRDGIPPSVADAGGEVAAATPAPSSSSSRRKDRSPSQAEDVGRQPEGASEEEKRRGSFSTPASEQQQQQAMPPPPPPPPPPRGSIGTPGAERGRSRAPRSGGGSRRRREKTSTGAHQHHRHRSSEQQQQQHRSRSRSRSRSDLTTGRTAAAAAAEVAAAGAVTLPPSRDSSDSEDSPAEEPERGRHQTQAHSGGRADGTPIVRPPRLVIPLREDCIVDSPPLPGGRPQCLAPQGPGTRGVASPGSAGQAPPSLLERGGEGAVQRTPAPAAAAAAAPAAETVEEISLLSTSPSPSSSEGEQQQHPLDPEGEGAPSDPYAPQQQQLPDQPRSTTDSSGESEGEEPMESEEKQQQRQQAPLPAAPPANATTTAPAFAPAQGDACQGIPALSIPVFQQGPGGELVPVTWTAQLVQEVQAFVATRQPVWGPQGTSCTDSCHPLERVPTVTTRASSLSREREQRDRELLRQKKRRKERQEERRRRKWDVPPQAQEAPGTLDSTAGRRASPPRTPRSHPAPQAPHHALDPFRVQRVPTVGIVRRHRKRKPPPIQVIEGGRGRQGEPGDQLGLVAVKDTRAWRRHTNPSPPPDQEQQQQQQQEQEGDDRTWEEADEAAVRLIQVLEEEEQSRQSPPPPAPLLPPPPQQETPAAPSQPPAPDAGAELATALQGHWRFVLLELEMAPWTRKDLVLLWRHLVQCLEEEAEEEEHPPDISRYSHEQTLKQLQRGRDLLLDGLRGKVQNPASRRRLRVEKGRALDLTDRAARFKRSRKATAWPVWLTDGGMGNLLRGLNTYWQAQLDRWRLAGSEPADEPKPPLLDSPAGGRPVSLEHWLQWLSVARRVMERRCADPASSTASSAHQEPASRSRSNSGGSTTSRDAHRSPIRWKGEQQQQQQQQQPPADPGTVLTPPPELPPPPSPRTSPQPTRRRRSATRAGGGKQRQQQQQEEKQQQRRSLSWGGTRERSPQRRSGSSQRQQHQQPPSPPPGDRTEEVQRTVQQWKEADLRAQEEVHRVRRDASAPQSILVLDTSSGSGGSGEQQQQQQQQQRPGSPPEGAAEEPMEVTVVPQTPSTPEEEEDRQQESSPEKQQQQQQQPPQEGEISTSPSLPTRHCLLQVPLPPLPPPSQIVAAVAAPEHMVVVVGPREGTPPTAPPRDPAPKVPEVAPAPAEPPAKQKADSAPKTLPPKEQRQPKRGRAGDASRAAAAALDGDTSPGAGAGARDRSRSPLKSSPQDRAAPQPTPREHRTSAQPQGSSTATASPPPTLLPGTSQSKSDVEMARAAAEAERGGGATGAQQNQQPPVPSTSSASAAPAAPVPTVAGGRSYASAARGTPPRAEAGGGPGQAPRERGNIALEGGVRPLTAADRARVRRELEDLEDNSFLRAFFREEGGSGDPWQRYVIRLRYRGRDPDSFTRTWVEDLLEEGLQLTCRDVPFIVSLQGIREIDLDFHREDQYAHFWEVCKRRVEENPALLQDVLLMPLFRGEVKVMNIGFRTSRIPPEDLDRWLMRHCDVLLRTQRKVDDRGYSGGEYRAIVQLRRDPDTGAYHHLPKYFFLGADRGYTRYSGQPPACFGCGGWYHFRADCVVSLCSKCGGRGHRTAECSRPVTCNLCGLEGHEYKMCPQAQLNLEHPEYYQRELLRVEEERLRQEQERARGAYATPQQHQHQRPEQRHNPSQGGQRQGGGGGGDRGRGEEDEEGGPGRGKRRRKKKGRPREASRSLSGVRGGERRERHQGEPGPLRSQVSDVSDGEGDPSSSSSTDSDNEEGGAAAYPFLNSKQRRQQLRRDKREAVLREEGKKCAAAMKEQHLKAVAHFNQEIQRRKAMEELRAQKDRGEGGEVQKPPPKSPQPSPQEPMEVPSATPPPPPTARGGPARPPKAPPPTTPRRRREPRGSGPRRRTER